MNDITAKDYGTKRRPGITPAEIEQWLDEHQIVDPAWRRLLVALRVGQGRDMDGTTNKLEIGNTIGGAIMEFLDSFPLIHDNDLLKCFREQLFGLEDYRAGRPGRLEALRGEVPEKPGSAPTTEAIDAAIAFCVQKLHQGRVFSVSAAAVRVAKRATDAGLPRTWGTVRQVYYAVTSSPPQDLQAAALLDKMNASIHLPDWAQRGQEDRERWLDEMTLFDKLR